MKQLVILISVLFSLSAFAQEFKMKESIDSDGIESVKVNTEDANITVEATKGSKIEIDAYRLVKGEESGDFKLVAEKDGKDLIIQEVRPKKMIRTTYEKEYRINIKMPSSLSLAINDEDGNIIISQLENNVAINLEDGNITMNECNGDNIVVNLEDGNIKLEKCSGKLIINSEDGNLKINDSKFSSITFNSEDGNCKINNSLSKNGQYVFNTEDGNIDFSMSASGANALINTEDGNVSYDEEFKVIMNNEHSKKMKMGDGSADIRINTEDGNVKLSHY